MTKYAQDPTAPMAETSDAAAAGRPAQRCRWCGRLLNSVAARGRPRRYCRQSCRQRHYEARRRSEELGLSENEVVLARRELGSLMDQLYMLEAAVEDVDRDLARAADAEDYRRALEWLLEAARPLVAQGSIRL